MRLLGQGTEKERRGDLEVAQRLSWFIAAVLPHPPRWQHSPTMPCPWSSWACEGGPSLIASILPRESSALCLGSSFPPLLPTFSWTRLVAAHFFQPKAWKSWVGLGSHCI